jgi:hypothetical protein
MPCDYLGIIMASPAHFGNILGISNLMQSRGDMIVKPENKLVLFMTNPASAQSRLRNARTDPFKERERPIERIIVTVQTVRHVF